MFESLVGNVLLSSPFMEDSHFYRSVVFLLQHSEEEAFGLILNRPTDLRLDKAVSMLSETPCVHDVPLYCGGPVEGPLIAFHNRGDLGGHPFMEGLYVTTDEKELLHVFSERDVILKVFDGFSGWGPLQLEGELETGSWLVSDISTEQIFGDPSELWEQLVKKIGNSIVTSNLNSPTRVDPDWN